VLQLSNDSVFAGEWLDATDEESLDRTRQLFIDDRKAPLELNGSKLPRGRAFLNRLTQGSDLVKNEEAGMRAFLKRLGQGNDLEESDEGDNPGEPAKKPLPNQQRPVAAISQLWDLKRIPEEAQKYVQQLAATDLETSTECQSGGGLDGQ
jgi:hypothetical protein